MAGMEEVLHLVEARQLFSKGIAFVDLPLLASCLMAEECRLLTRDRRLRTAA